MPRPSAALLAVLASLVAAPTRAQGPLEPSGHLPPVAAPSVPTPPETPPKKATPVQPVTPLPRGAVLEQVNGKVQEVDRKGHRIVVDVSGERVTLSLDRNTMVYTPSGLGTALDVIPGAQIRAGRNAEFVAYWVQVRPPGVKGSSSPAPTPGQGTGPAGGAGAPPETGGSVAPGGGAAPSPVTPAPGGGGMP